MWWENLRVLSSPVIVLLEECSPEMARYQHDLFYCLYSNLYIFRYVYWYCLHMSLYPQGLFMLKGYCIWIVLPYGQNLSHCWHVFSVRTCCGFLAHIEKIVNPKDACYYNAFISPTRRPYLKSIWPIAYVMQLCKPIFGSMKGISTLLH